MQEAGECVPFPGTILLSPKSIPVSPYMRWCKGKKDFWWSRDHLGQNQTSLGKWIFKNLSQTGRWVPLFLPSSGFIRRLLYFKWQKPNSNKFNTAPPTFGFWQCNLLAHEIRTPKIRCLQAGLGPGVQIMSLMLSVLHLLASFSVLISFLSRFSSWGQS